MKLILCYACASVVSLSSKQVAHCECGRSSGQYEQDGWHAWISGPCDALGFSNASLYGARQMQSVHPTGIHGFGHRFEAFFIPDPCVTVKRKTSDG